MILATVYEHVGHEGFLNILRDTLIHLNEEPEQFYQKGEGEWVRKTPGGVFMAKFKADEGVELNVKKRVNKELRARDRVNKKKYKALLAGLSKLGI